MIWYSFVSRRESNDVKVTKIRMTDLQRKDEGKISEQPYTTLHIQFLDLENNEKNNTFPLGKQICFT